VADRKVMELLAQMVPVGSHVLDLGCGDGALLEYLQRERQCTGYGVEIDDANLLACARRGVNVIQLNLEEGLAMFDDASFDVVLQIDTLQHLHNTETMLRETVRVGRSGVVAFPNFGYWKNRLSILRGLMPVNTRLPYEWYDTPNIRVTTMVDFLKLAKKNNIVVQQALGLNDNGEPVAVPNLMASFAIFRF
jgi:methionine biosynthesis protein MetW